MLPSCPTPRAREESSWVSTQLCLMPAVMVLTIDYAVLPG